MIKAEFIENIIKIDYIVLKIWLQHSSLKGIKKSSYIFWQINCDKSKLSFKNFYLFHKFDKSQNHFFQIFCIFIILTKLISLILTISRVTFNNSTDLLSMLK